MIFETEFRRYLKGTPESDVHPPVPDDGIAIGTLLDTEIARIEADVQAASAGLTQTVLWTSLFGAPGTKEGQPGRVVGPDAGQHTDPVTATLVDNEGEYSWNVASNGWERVGDISASEVTLNGTEILTNKTVIDGILAGGTVGSMTSLGMETVGTANDIRFRSTEAGLTADRDIFWNVGDSNRGITLGGNLAFGGGFVTVGTDAVQFNVNGPTDVSLPGTGTLVNDAVLSKIMEGTAVVGPYGDWPYAVVDKDSQIRMGIDPDGKFAADIDLAYEKMGKTSFNVDDWGYVESTSDGAHAGRLKNGVRFDLGDGRQAIPAIENVAGTDQLVSYSPDGIRRVLTGGGIDHVGGIPAYGKSARVALARPMFGDHRNIAVALDGSGVCIPDDPDTIVMLLGRGQSLIVGSNGTDQYFFENSIYKSHTLMFESSVYSDVRCGINANYTTNALLDGNTLTGFTPAQAKAGVSGYGGQDMLTAAANYINFMAMKHCGKTVPILVASAGSGGATQAQVGPGDNPWTNKLTMVQRGHDLATAEGKRLFVIVVSAHGEANATTTSTAYATEEINQRNLLSTAVQGITGQIGEVPWVVSQWSSLSEAADNETTSTSVIGIQEAEVLDPANYIIAGPNYGYGAYYHTDFVHGTGRFYAHAGELLGRTIIERVFGDTGQPALRWDSVAYDDPNQRVIATVNRTAAEFALESTIVASQANEGLEVSTGSGSFVTINAVNIVGNTVEIDVASDLTGTTAYLQTGMLAHGGTRALATIPRTNFATTDSRFSLVDGLPDPDRMLHQRNLITGT